MTKEYQRVYNWLNTAKKLPKEFTLPSPQKLALWVKLMKEEIAEFEEAVEKGDEKEVRKEYADILYVYYNMAAEMGYNHPERDFHLVSDSNATKFCKTKEEADETLKKYDKKGVSTKYYKNNDKYIITDTEGKIKKGIGYIPCELPDREESYRYIPEIQIEGETNYLTFDYALTNNPYEAAGFETIKEAVHFIDSAVSTGKLFSGWKIEEHLFIDS